MELAFFESLDIFLLAVFLCITPFDAVFAIIDVVILSFVATGSFSLLSMAVNSDLTAVFIRDFDALFLVCLIMLWRFLFSADLCIANRISFVLN